MRGEMLKGHLDMLLLSVVARESGHGYAIVAALRDQSSGAFDLAEGTVYPALHRLEASGLLSSRWKVMEGRKRRIYSLTAQGRRALGAQRDEWETFVFGARSVLGAAT